MMAPDRPDESGGGRYPSRTSVEGLRGALSRYVVGPVDGEKEAAVCEALANLASEARERKLYAEHMLIAFKHLWAEMPEVKAIPMEADRRRLLDRLVKMCIDTYYTR